MNEPRVVIVENISNGTSKVTEDFRPSPFFVSEDGHKMTELWFSNKTSTQSSAPCDIQKEFTLNLETNSKRFLHTVLPPFSKVKQYAEDHEFSVDKNFLMHNTTTIDFAVVLKGKVELVTENGIITLNEGDCVVQKATIHGWVNPGEVPAEMIFVMIGVDVPKSFKSKNVDSKVPVHIEYPSKKN
jgi:mannose-6-phosphate isomerase-like protein (cupin superfamily)